MDMLKHAWDGYQQAFTAQRKLIEKDIKRRQSDIDALLERYMQTDNVTIQKALEVKISQQEQNKLTLKEKHRKTTKPKADFETQARTLLDFLLSPYNIWDKSDQATKRTLLKLIFGGHLVYGKKTGARTLDTPYLFKVIQELKDHVKKNSDTEGQMVRPRSVKPIIKIVLLQ